jgi:hypothetical protein
MKLTSLRKLFYNCLVLASFLVGCPAQTGSGVADQPAPGTPQTVAYSFMQACFADDQAKVLNLLAPLTREAVVSSGSNPCRHLPPAPAAIGAIETAGETAYVRYEWQAEGITAESEITLIQMNTTWFVVDSQIVYQRPTRTPLPSAPTIAPAVAGEATGEAP